MKAVVLVMPDEAAEDVSRLISAALTINGYRGDLEPQIIDWPSATYGCFCGDPSKPDVAHRSHECLPIGRVHPGRAEGR